MPSNSDNSKQFQLVETVVIYNAVINRKSGTLMKKSIRVKPVRINIMESLILAQNERWRRVLSMQVERQLGAIPMRAADW